MSRTVPPTGQWSRVSAAGGRHSRRTDDHPQLRGRANRKKSVSGSPHVFKVLLWGDTCTGAVSQSLVSHAS